MIYPALPLPFLLAAWGALGTLALYWQHLSAWLLASAVLVTILLLDAGLLLLIKLPTTTRSVSGSLPVGVKVSVTLSLANPSRSRLRLTLHDHIPPSFKTTALPINVTLQPNQRHHVEYDLTPTERGTFTLPQIQLVQHSRLKLWRRNNLATTDHTVRVYPNFRNVAKYALLATDNRISLMGIRKRRRRGDGIEFNQLREFREGDSLRQVDWKASSRSRRIISREYQDERDQQIIFLLDCSRRMRSYDGTLSHFDHSLNALLLLTYVAMRQGDAVGLQCFGGHDRWLKPQKGNAVMNSMLNTVFDLQPTLHTADFTQLTEQLIQHQKRRSLLVILSNIRPEDNDDLAPSLSLLSKRHLVLLANLRETILDKTQQRPITQFNDALTYAGITEYLAARNKTQQQLSHSGALQLDVTPNQLPIAIVNRYLEIKQANQL